MRARSRTGLSSWWRWFLSLAFSPTSWPVYPWHFSRLLDEKQTWASHIKHTNQLIKTMQPHNDKTEKKTLKALLHWWQLTSGALASLPDDQVADRCRRESAVGSRHKDALAVAAHLLVEVFVGQRRRVVLDLTRLLQSNSISKPWRCAQLGCVNTRT